MSKVLKLEHVEVLNDLLLERIPIDEKLGENNPLISNNPPGKNKR